MLGAYTLGLATLGYSHSSTSTKPYYVPVRSARASAVGRFSGLATSKQPPSQQPGLWMPNWTLASNRVKWN